jgi:hypothetical protein
MFIQSAVPAVVARGMQGPGGEKPGVDRKGAVLALWDFRHGTALVNYRGFRVVFHMGTDDSWACNSGKAYRVGDSVVGAE